VLASDCGGHGGRVGRGHRDRDTRSIDVGTILNPALGGLLNGWSYLAGGGDRQTDRAGAPGVGQLLIAQIGPGKNDDDRHRAPDDARSPEIETSTMAA
jgi:hypothetical protein